MYRNYWAERVRVRALNLELAVLVAGFIGEVWSDDLKRLISAVALKFMEDHDLSSPFAVQIERTSTVEVFRGIRIV